jgi:hypothetical protein
MRFLIRSLDQLLRKLTGVFVYWDDPDCMFRARLTRATRPLLVPGGTVPQGARVLELHFWNEHMPSIPPEGVTLAQAARGHRMLIRSLREIGGRIPVEDRYAGVEAVGGATVLVVAGGTSSAEKLFERLGFRLTPYRSPLGRFGEFWENLYTWALMWAYNQVSLENRHLLQLERTEVWMSAEGFVARYNTHRSGEAA